jgi:hypothetical protein
MKSPPAYIIYKPLLPNGFVAFINRTGAITGPYYLLYLNTSWQSHSVLITACSLVLFFSELLIHLEYFCELP